MLLDAPGNVTSKIQALFTSKKNIAAVKIKETYLREKNWIFVFLLFLSIAIFFGVI